jgi:serine/threonine protein kinase/Flp pilus assembly protein TadD
MKMVGKAVEFLATELDEFIEAYESERARVGHADLASFLPPRDHSLYVPVLRELARVELEYGWRGGQPRRLPDYQDRFPELFQDRECLQAITFEEYRLRQQMGENPSPLEYKERWGVNIEGWPRHHGRSSNQKKQQSGSEEKLPEATKSSTQITPFPDVGAEFLDFHLLAELGRGAFSQVYLARQRDLAGRPVVLKISSHLTVEERTLAQLQHTNIIPIYSVHKSGALHVMCMPYLGSVTLADVLRDLGGRDSLPQSGKALADTARACQSTTRPNLEAENPDSNIGNLEISTDLMQIEPVVWKQLEAYSYVQAVLWMASRLSDGLAHAHERGILHRDLKPANILLTDDGQPMLLDFNLSQDTKAPSDSPAFVGGTLPYMAPEHLRAFQQSALAQDARSDLYSLGVILFELLTGRQPFPRRTGPIDDVLARMREDRTGSPPLLRGFNRAVSPATESIVRHCLEPNPERRYQSARQLHEDLQRHLENRPLQYAPEPSLRELVGKAVRRNPRMAIAGIATLALLLIACLASLVWLRNNQLARWESAALCQQYRDELQQARLILATSRPAEHERLDEGIALATRALDRYGILQNASWRDGNSFRRLSGQDQEQMREETGQVLLLLASVTGYQAQHGDPARRDNDLRSALNLNRLAESCCSDGKIPSLLWRQRDELNQLLDPSAKTSTGASVRPNDPSTAQDFCLLAQDLMGQNRAREALPLWKQATRLGPKNLWTWIGLAMCHEDLGNYQEARAAYSTGIALVPSLSWLYFKRGQALLNMKDYVEARADIDRFLEDRPDVPEGYINRALALQGLHQDELAVDNLTEAIRLGTTQTRVYFIRSLLRTRIGDKEGARKDQQRGLELQPADELSWVVRGLAKIENNPKAALSDLNQALHINPYSLDGLQNKASVLSEQLGRTGEAIEILNRAVELYPDFIPARAGRGVLLARLGKRKEAHRDAENCLIRDVQPATLYQVAGVYALTFKEHPEDLPQALLLLSCALAKGYGQNLLAIDPDLEPIRKHPEFVRLVAQTKTLKGETAEKEGSK